jgi:hypothetical protein
MKELGPGNAFLLKKLMVSNGFVGEMSEKYPQNALRLSFFEYTSAHRSGWRKKYYCFFEASSQHLSTRPIGK